MLFIDTKFYDIATLNSGFSYLHQSNSIHIFSTSILCQTTAATTIAVNFYNKLVPPVY